MAEALDGLLTFFASHYAIRAEMLILKEGIDCQLIPGPKELSPNCGVALRFEYRQRARVEALLAKRQVKVDELHPYEPRTDGWKPSSLSQRLFGK
ncbi:MAG: DUF3343 domain-containing protein [Halopseudomonas sp.]